MKKRLLSLVLTAVMGMSLLVGCGGTTNQTETKETEVTKVETESSATKESETAPKEVENIVLYFNGGDANTDRDAVIKAMNEYSSEKIGVTITFKPIASGEYLDTVNRTLAAKEDIDLIWASAGVATAVTSGKGAMDISALLEKHPDLVNAMPEVIWDSIKINGNSYFVPNYKEAGNGMTLFTPVAVADAVKEKTGIDFNEIEISSLWEIGAYEEYILAAMDIVDMEVPFPNVYKIADWISYGGTNYEMLNKPFVFNMDTNTVYNMLEIPELKEYIPLVNSWKDKGIFVEKLIVKGYNADEILTSGKFAISGWPTVPNNEAQLDARYGIDMYAKEITSPLLTSNSAMGSGWLISANSEHGEACIKWLELVNTDTTFADMWLYGIEGTHYTKDANGIVTKIADSGWTMEGWRATNAWVVSLCDTDAENKKEAYTEFNSGAKASPLLGFRGDFTEVNAELSACTAPYFEYTTTLSVGFVDASELENIAKNNASIGSPKVVETIQKQVDEFLGK